MELMVFRRTQGYYEDTGSIPVTLSRPDASGLFGDYAHFVVTGGTWSMLPNLIYE